MNPLFTLGEEFRFHDSSRFREKAGDAKLPFYHSFVPVLMSLAAESCRSRAESVHLLEPHLQWGKSWKSSNFVTPDDSARNRKMRKIFFLFFWSAPVAFRRVALETPEWTSRDSNHHRQSVSAGKTNAIPTEPSGRLPQDAQDDVTELFDLFDAHFWGWKGI